MAFVYERRIEFGDTDMAGIVHFANYFRFMEAAETAFLRSRGLSVSWADETHRYGFPRVSVACDFVRPARFEDVLQIGVSIEKIGKKSITYRFDFHRGDAELAVGRATSVYCRGVGHDQFESLEIPTELRTRLLGDA